MAIGTGKGDAAVTFLEDQIAKIQDSSTRIVYPEGAEPNILRAAADIVRRGFATPILLGKKEEIEQAAAEAGVSLEGIALICPADDQRRTAYADMFAEANHFPASAAAVMLKKPLYFGAMMVKAGDADCIVAGLATETDEVVAAYKLIVGMAEGVNIPSCFTVLEIPNFEGPQGDLLALSDTAINIDPSAEELADIALSSARSVREILGWEPRVAMLSFSTCGSANHERAQKVAEAVAIAKTREPSLLIDGEMQLDTAIAPEIAIRKVKRPSDVAGKANVLIFPNLDAANIGTKLLQRIAKAQSNGGVLQGFAKPVSDVSRGASAENILRISVMLTRAIQSQKAAE